MSQCLRGELAGAGIGVVAICPGFVNTNIASTTRFVGRDTEHLPCRVAQREPLVGAARERGRTGADLRAHQVFLNFVKQHGRERYLGLALRGERVVVRRRNVECDRLQLPLVGRDRRRLRGWLRRRLW